MSSHPDYRPSSERALEIFLIIIAIALVTLFHTMPDYKLVVLNLFFLPVVLGGFYLGRYRAGVLAILCVIGTSVVVSLDLTGFAVFNSPVIVGLTVVMWGAVLGLTAILVGTLSDERSEKMSELHEAYVGVVQVLSKYLQSANPQLEEHANQVAELCHDVAVRLKLSEREVDDIRVAALLHDMENVEITSRVIRRAVGNMEEDIPTQYTFHGTDLVQSLGSVLTGALPLLIEQSDALDDESAENPVKDEVAIGARIIHAVRAYVLLNESNWGGQSIEETIDELRSDQHVSYDPLVLDTLGRVLGEQVAEHIKQEVAEELAV